MFWTSIIVLRERGVYYRAINVIRRFIELEEITDTKAKKLLKKQVGILVSEHNKNFAEFPFDESIVIHKSDHSYVYEDRSPKITTEGTVAHMAEHFVTMLNNILIMRLKSKRIRKEAKFAYLASAEHTINEVKGLMNIVKNKES